MDWLVDLSYFGLFIGSFLGGTVLPVSVDMLVIGILVLGGNPWITLIVATVGNWLGGAFSYRLGWLGSWDWLERRFNVTKEKLEKQQRKVERYGVWVVLISSLPTVGAICLIALGFYKVKPKTTMLLLLLVCFVRISIWVFLYWMYGDHLLEWINR